jgi:hypothetical protein
LNQYFYLLLYVIIVFTTTTSTTTTTMSSMMMNVPDWDPSQVRYMAPKVNDKGGKTINVISTQTNRAIHLSTPQLTTWGITDYVNEKGESDNKFTMSLSFPSEGYRTDDSDVFLDKLKAFETHVLSDAVDNSVSWWGEKLDPAVIKHNFFPFLKYPKDKSTGRVDTTRAPNMRCKVAKYTKRQGDETIDNWGIEVYNSEGTKLFPCDDNSSTPIDFVPSRSDVKCLIQCTGIWIGGKGWGLLWRVNQCGVKPAENATVFGKCHVTFTEEEKKTTTTKSSSDDDESDTDDTVPADTTQIEDSDEEEEEAPVVDTPPPTPVKTPAAPKKRIVRKKTTTQ